MPYTTDNKNNLSPVINLQCGDDLVLTMPLFCRVSNVNVPGGGKFHWYLP